MDVKKYESCTNKKDDRNFIIKMLIKIFLKLTLLFFSLLPIIKNGLTNKLYILIYIFKYLRIDFEKKSLDCWRKPYLSVICDFEDKNLSWKLIHRNNIPVWKCINKNTETDIKPIVYIHGGGLSGGNPSCFKAFIYKLSFLTHKNVEVVNYRLCPEFTKENGIDDFRNYILDINRKWKNISLIADSAGCYIIHNFIKKYNKYAKNFNIIIFMSPMLGLTKLKYLSDNNDCTACVGTYKMCYTLAKIKPPEKNPNKLKYYGKNIIIFAAKNETIFPDSEKLYKFLIKNNFKIKNVFKDTQIHAWPVLQGLNIKEMKETLTEISIEILKKY